MKSKAQKRAEAIERNAQYRDKYLKQAKAAGLEGEKAEVFANIKQGYWDLIPTDACLRRSPRLNGLTVRR